MTLDWQTRKKAALVFQDGRVFEGWGFGAPRKVSGQVNYVTSTAAGYNEALTDPANVRRILVWTYPLVGNYGSPAWERDAGGLPRVYESPGATAAGFVVSEVTRHPSSVEADKTLAEFMADVDLPGIEDVDTRALTRLVRREGPPLAILAVTPAGTAPDVAALVEEAKTLTDPNEEHLVQAVSTKEIVEYNPAGLKTAVIIDCGVKASLIKALVARDLKVVRVPFDASADQVQARDPTAVIVAGGPGNPAKCEETIACVKALVDGDLPVMGIGLGNQIVGLALGGKVVRLPAGHWGANKPVLDQETGRCYVTTQNHQFAIDPASLAGSTLEIGFQNANDDTVEGVIHPTKPVLGIEFDPALHDVNFLDDFLDPLVQPAGGGA